MNPPDEGRIICDLLFASSGIEAEIVAASSTENLIAGLSRQVAQVGHLIALKILARDDAHRPQDAIDLRALMKVASKEALVQAEEALALIGKRGFSRERNLLADFAAWRAG